MSYEVEMKFPLADADAVTALRQKLAELGAEAVSETAASNDSADAVFSALQNERDQFFESWKRVQAEFENYRRRAQREREQEAKYVAIPVIRDLLPGLDNLRRSLEAANKNGKLEELTKGVEMTLKQLESILDKHEAKPIHWRLRFQKRPRQQPQRCLRDWIVRSWFRSWSFRKFENGN